MANLATRSHELEWRPTPRADAPPLDPLLKGSPNPSSSTLTLPVGRPVRKESMTRSKMWAVWRGLATLGRYVRLSPAGKGQEGQTRTGASLPHPPLSDPPGCWWPTWQPGGTSSTDDQHRGINCAKQTPKYANCLQPSHRRKTGSAKQKHVTPTDSAIMKQFAPRPIPVGQHAWKNDFCLYKTPPSKSQG